jgi:hypothetical protein
MRKRVYKILLGVVLALLILLAPIAMIRYEQWQFRNAAGQQLMSMGGFRLVGMGMPDPDTDQAAWVTGHGAGWFGMFRFSVDQPYGVK